MIQQSENRATAQAKVGSDCPPEKVDFKNPSSTFEGFGPLANALIDPPVSASEAGTTAQAWARSSGITFLYGGNTPDLAAFATFEGDAKITPEIPPGPVPLNFAEFDAMTQNSKAQCVARVNPLEPISSPAVVFQSTVSFDADGPCIGFLIATLGSAMLECEYDDVDGYWTVREYTVDSSYNLSLVGIVGTTDLEANPQEIQMDLEISDDQPDPWRFQGINVKLFDVEPIWPNRASTSETLGVPHVHSQRNISVEQSAEAIESP